MMTAKELVQGFPFTRNWTPARRARLLSGLNRLQDMIVYDSQESLIGVIIISPDQEEVDARIMTKNECLAQARLWELRQCEIDAIESSSHPGELYVLVLAGSTHVVFGLPVRRESVTLQ